MTIYRHEFAFDIESKLSDEQIDNVQNYLKYFTNDDRVMYNRYEVPAELTISNRLGSNSTWGTIHVVPEPLTPVRTETVSSSVDEQIPY